MTVQPADASHAKNNCSPLTTSSKTPSPIKRFRERRSPLAIKAKFPCTRSANSATSRKLRAVTVQTRYDIASLTKVVATTTLVAKLVEGDFPVPLDLDAKIDRYLPEWSTAAQSRARNRKSGAAKLPCATC